MTTKNYRIFGRVTERQHGQGVPGVRVEAWDKDLIIDDLLGSAVTEADGSFEISFETSYFKELFMDRQPDLYFKIFDQDELIKSTEDSVLWNVDAEDSEVIIELEEAPLLVLKQEQFRENMTVLFENLQTDEQLKQSFIKNPTGVIASRVVKKALPPQEESESNRLIFSLLSNDRMLNWFDTYAQENEGKEISKPQFIMDFSKAITDINDNNINTSLLGNVGARGGITGLSDFPDICAIYIMNIHGALSFRLFQTLRFVQRLDISHGFPVNLKNVEDVHASIRMLGIQFGVDEARINPAFVRETVEMLISVGKELSASGQLADLNTEIRGDLRT